MSGLGIKAKYAHECKGSCGVCDLVDVLVQVEGFHDEVADIRIYAPCDDTRIRQPHDRIVDAVDGAALRGYMMAVQKYAPLSTFRALEAIQQEIRR